MVSTVITATQHNNNTRWSTSHNNKWSLTTATTTTKKRQQQGSNEKRDPFAGMKSCVNYQQEIERLKQLVPSIDNKRKPPLYHHHHHNTTLISRSNSPDDTTDSDSTTSTSTSSTISSTNTSTSAATATAVVTEEEQLRFLAFVRNWTGDWQQKNNNNSSSINDHFGLLNTTDHSFWVDPSPWTAMGNGLDHPASSTMMSSNNIIPYHNYYLTYWQQPQQPIHVNRHGQLPIGMGRKKS
ncbi:MAG: hypothetical protein EXX96DRAFT_584694 [Benjaminiella poitrasii]|nr:MAG: hypothetical protein EXX96DRAFT_584694 [Benjaminiella poitrasii]